ncbi:arsenical pump membrane protein-domain-containing protein [Halteromyces radiatus]|uniref:arsenical pump membrane protein-domain-containing protein n=1 Tax=Halteromyces radiatus TaxID=101107 RepID=UPI00222044B0|nr:arsenical pump membrane protein-domain-containing protein [Halteromyces radiatus]KAI8093351.1 arsenical pump membrane protein-domain-containing protein [Halteromyces radiatus]
MDSGVKSTNLDAYSWVTLTFFLLAIVFVIRPVKIPLGKRQTSTTKRWYLYLNLATAPPLAVLILLLCQATDITTIKIGLIGSLGIQPYSILILFYSLAYICVSLDMTGIFQFLAFWVAKRAGSRGHLAFTLFFILTSVMSGLTSNDVVILTGTAFLAYFTRVSGILPIAFMMSEFISANIASMALFIGNPTNVVVSTAYNISFIQYSAWMLLPTIGGLMMAYLMLRIVFRHQRYLPKEVPAPDEEIDPTSFLIDRFGAYFGIALLVICLLTLIGTSFVSGVEVWMVTLPFGGIALLRDLWYDVRHRIPTPATRSSFSSDRMVSLSTVNRDTVLTTSELDHELSIIRSKKTDGDGTNNQQEEKSIEYDNDDDDSMMKKQEYISSRWKDKIRIMQLWWLHQQSRSVTITVWRRLPWTILPFSLGMFVLVEILSQVGWTGTFAGLLVGLTKHYMVAVVGMMIVTVILCQLLNNLPATILLTRIIEQEQFTNQMEQSPIVKNAILFGLIAGSNLGACLTLVGSLAGIMFEHILRTKGILNLGYFQFAKWNVMLLPSIVITVVCILILELYVIFIIIQ